jgi:hypothetical protein
MSHIESHQKSGKFLQQMAYASIRHLLGNKNYSLLIINDQSKNEALMALLLFQVCESSVWRYRLKNKEKPNLTWKKFARSLGLPRQDSSQKKDGDSVDIAEISKLVPQEWHELIILSISKINRVFDLKGWNNSSTEIKR